MLAKFGLSIVIGAGVLLSSCAAQSQTFSPNFETSGIPVSPAAFKSSFNSAEAQADDEDPEASLVELTEKLSKQVERLELRIRELEYDVEEKLEEEGEEGSEEASEAQAEANEAFVERFEVLEEGFETQEKAIDNFSSTLPGLVHHGHKSPKIQFFGRIHLDYFAFPKVDETAFPLEGENPQDRVEFRRIRIGVKGDLNDNVFYKYEGEFAGGIDPSYRDVFLGFRDLPILGSVIIGNHKRPYGLDHLNSSRHNIFLERPFIVEALNEDARRLGVSANGNTDDLGLNWRYGVYHQGLTQTGPGWIGDEYQLELAGRLARTAWYDESSGGRGYAHFAISGSVGNVDGDPDTNVLRFRTRPESRTTERWLNTDFIDGADDTSILGLETAINVGSWHFSGEYLRAGVDRFATSGPDVDFDGGYFQSSYIWTGEHHPWNRKTGTLARLKPFENFFLVRDGDGALQSGWGAWETAVRYSWANLNDSDINGGDGTAWTFALNWYWNPYSRIQLNYINGNIENGPNGGFGDYEIFGARVQVDF